MMERGEALLLRHASLDALTSASDLRDRLWVDVAASADRELWQEQLDAMEVLPPDTPAKQVYVGGLVASRTPMRFCVAVPPDGSGAVLVEQDARTGEWRVVWWTAYYVGDHATNNEAEHEALRQGVLECVRRYNHTPVQLTVIGDSALVLGQVAGHTRSSHRNTQRATTQTQHALRALPATVLRHTLRAGNKMADWLANIAMDRRVTSSSTTSWTDADAHLTHLMPADLQHDTRPLTRPLQLLQQLSAHLNQADLRASVPSRKRPRG
jgi:ribonuclease HI